MKTMEENSSTKNVRKIVVVIQNEYNLELPESQGKQKQWVMEFPLLEKISI